MIKKDRQPIGVGVMPEKEPWSEASVVVVCDDGSVWAMGRYDGEWEEGKPIPGSYREQVSSRMDTLKEVAR